MKPDLDLLRKAYPVPLAIRGLETCGHWVCVGGPDKFGMSAWIYATDSEGASDLTWTDPVGIRSGIPFSKLTERDVEPFNTTEEEVAHRDSRARSLIERLRTWEARGDFLPRVDPDGAPGTWFLLLHELGKATGARLEGVTGLTWLHFTGARNHTPGWMLAFQSSWTEVALVIFGDCASGSQGAIIRVSAPEFARDEKDPVRALLLARVHVRGIGAPQSPHHGSRPG